MRAVLSADQPWAARRWTNPTRAAVNLVLHDVPRRYPNIKMILSHGGGFVPYAAYRATAAIVGQTGRDLNEVLDSFRSFWFDTALTSSPAALPSLLAFAHPDRILYGSDWPFAPELAVAVFTSMLDGHNPDPVQLQAVNRGNAEGLFPRLAS